MITSGIARMNLFLHGVENFQIIRGVAPADSKHIEGDLLQMDALVETLDALEHSQVSGANHANRAK